MHPADANDYDALVFERTRGLPRNVRIMKRETLERLEKNPASDLDWYLLGHLFYIEGHFAKAAECFRKCMRLNSTVKNYSLGLAFSLRQMGEYSASDEIIFSI